MYLLYAITIAIAYVVKPFRDGNQSKFLDKEHQWPMYGVCMVVHVVHAPLKLPQFVVILRLLDLGTCLITPAMRHADSTTAQAPMHIVRSSAFPYERQ